MLCACALLLRDSAASAQSADTGPRVTIIRDAETETLLRNFANPLFRAAGVEPGLVRILILRDDAINSFVTTGNRMFIHTGLITRAESAGEMIGVIAHETGHIRGGHLAKLPELMREALITSIGSLLIGAAAGIASGNPGAAIGTGLGGSQLAQRNFLSFTRGIEQSADQSAVQTLDRLHWSARGMLALFERLNEQESLLIGTDPYLQTHPLTRDRLAFVQQHVRTSPWSDAKFPDAFETDFAMMRAKLRAFLDPSSVTLARVKSTDASPPARYARAIALYRLGHTDEAVALIDGLLKDSPANPWLWELKGQVLFEGGRGPAAIPPYQEAVRLAPGQPLLRGELGRAMIEANNPALLRPAIEQLTSALAREHDESDYWRALATAYGKLGDLPNADLALAEESLLTGDIRAARFLATRASKALKPGPSQLRALDIANATKKENREGF